MPNMTNGQDADAINSSDAEKRSLSPDDKINVQNGQTDAPPVVADYHEPPTRDRKSRRSLPDAGYELEDPFGDAEEGGIEYRSMTWWQAGMIMIAETISLGILSLPSVLATIGLVGGLILIFGLGVVATYTGYVIGQFKLAYPYVYSMADAGEVLFKPLGPRWQRFGKEFLGAAQTIFLIFSGASHILTWTIAFNTMTGSATCTIVWSVIALVVFWICDLPRTLKKVSFMSMASFFSIITAVLVVMIGVGVDPKGVGLVATEKVAFAKAFLSVTNIIFAYAGHVAFFGFISELKDPREFPKALALLQISDTTMYMIVAAIIYRYTGENVTSPALGSASDVVKKVAYGLALPTIIVAGVVYGHVATKYVYVRIFRGTPHLRARSWYAWGVWALLAGTYWIIAWIIAESIPVFNDLLGLISALFASWFTYGLSGMFWLYMNYGQYTKSATKMFLFSVNVFIIIMAGAMCGIGLYASGKAIHDSSGNGSWTCKSNAQ